MSEMDAHDVILVKKLVEGDEKAFTTIYEKYWFQLYRKAGQKLQSDALAKEMVQEIFTNLWIKRSGLHIHCSLDAYLYSALKYTILDYFKSLKVRDKYVTLVRNTLTNYDNVTLDKINSSELEEKIRIAVNTLPERCRLIFDLSRQEQYSMKEIAKRLDISPKTVENQLSKARKILKYHLKEYVPFLLVFLKYIGF